MTYLSHPVRCIRDDPTEGEAVSLLLAFGDAPDSTVAAAREAVADLGGTVERDLQFSTLEVTVPETAVADVCALEGLDHVETSGTLGLAVETVDDEAENAAEADATDDRAGADREPRT